MKGNFQVRFGERSGETRRLQSRKVRPAPTLRTGGMLLATVEHVRANSGDPRTFFGKLYGQEKNLTTSSVRIFPRCRRRLPISRRRCCASARPRISCGC
jgi:hypothetical protein